MGEVVSLISPKRWLSEWRAAGGFVTLGDGPFGPDGQRTVGMLELAPKFSLSEPWDSPRRREVERLKRQVAGSLARLAVIAYMRRHEGTRYADTGLF